MRIPVRRVAILALIVLSVAVAIGVGQGTANRLTPTDIFNLQYATDPQISPDGSRIAYERHFADIHSDKRLSNIWIINFDGSNNRPLTTGDFDDTSPRWSPDRTRIAYLSDRDGTKQIYLQWLDTGQTAKLTNLTEPPSNLAWSPDGKQISFTALVPGTPPKLATLPTPPPGAKWADPPTIIDRLIYRFNRVGYLKPGFTQVFVVSAEGGAPRQLTTGNFPHSRLFGEGGGPVWTPDGKYLLLSANLRPDYEYEPLDTEIYEVSAVDGAVKQLTHRKGPDNFPAISPDGKAIAYTGFDDRYQGHQTTHLYLMNRDGSDPRVVTAKLDRDVDSPRWAPDGKGIFFVYDDQGDTKLGFYSLTGSWKEVASHLGTNGTAYASGAAFSLARNGNFAVTYTLPDLPGAIAVGSAQNPSLRVISDLNKELLAGKKLAQAEQVWFESSVDKRKIEAWILKPPDFDPTKKYPLILEIHGGPFANYGDRFDVEKQIYAASGDVVLYVNPRGSTSYGEEFANLIHHAYPGDDFYDLNSGVDTAIAKGYVEPNNLFVTGGSGGGVLTCWMIDRTDRFRGAASLYPVINWYSWVLTADIPSFGVQYWFPGPPWEYTEQYMKRSVISFVKNVKTPTLLMTGVEDYRTPISEAEQYYEALKLLKVESVLVRVPGEPHGVSLHPSHQVAKVLEVLAWFDQHRQRK